MFIFQQFLGFCKNSFFVESMLDIKLNVIEMWKKTIIDEKIDTNLVLKSDLNCDLFERRYSQKTEKDGLKTSFNFARPFCVGSP